MREITRQIVLESCRQDICACVRPRVVYAIPLCVDATHGVITEGRPIDPFGVVAGPGPDQAAPRIGGGLVKRIVLVVGEDGGKRAVGIVLSREAIKGVVIIAGANTASVRLAG